MASQWQQVDRSACIATGWTHPQQGEARTITISVGLTVVLGLFGLPENEYTFFRQVASVD